MNRRREIRDDELRRLYLDEHLTTLKLAEHFGCSEITIRRRMAELGIPARARGPQRASKNANPEWSPALAYAVGIIATDGNLSPDGRHITIRSKDYDLLETMKTCLDLTNRIAPNRKLLSTYFTLQWGDRAFYDWLQGIGLMPAKSLVRVRLPFPILSLAIFFEV
jgi:hypothetical protein